MFHIPLRFYQSCLRGASNREGLQPDVEEDYYRQAISGRPRGFGEGRQDRSDRGPLKGGAEHQQVPVCSRRRHLGALDERKFHTLPKQQAHPGDLTRALAVLDHWGVIAAVASFPLIPLRLAERADLG